MSDAETPPLTTPGSASTLVPARPASRRWFGPRLVVRGVRWAAELLIVFVGVYAAFLFNNYQSHRQERERRDQILAWMEETYADDLSDIKDEQANLRKEAADFEQQLRAGEMPALHTFNLRTDYDPSDVASLLTGGGLDLLEVQTVREIKDVESTLRGMIGVARHDQQLSDTYVLPNLEKGPSFFYDPESKQLRPGFHWYEAFYTSTLKDYATLQPQVERLLAQIRAERRRNR